jgi:hypothetical protein
MLPGQATSREEWAFSHTRMTGMVSLSGCKWKLGGEKKNRSAYIYLFIESRDFEYLLHVRGGVYRGKIFRTGLFDHA